ncbi:uncharacterized protein RCC_10621 [Ramularia collo-cygni]|uniref:BTB domain-containing protein n=1 Tax=Ramularia collo-cygni TaxID=112498 RepID=A0A2D3VA17_9PEZI|nr:uncharacterized protein RCC_10621 [Ramularia collo-cygni]CZT24893.1 uncharacterized protein RCC_10621 [Ramularia collo-cygni]
MDEERSEGVALLTTCPRDVAASIFADFYNSDLYTDLTIKLGDRTWRVHKLVVCSQSQVLASACNGKWKEAEEGTITLHEDAPAAVDAMLEFMYTGKYTQRHASADADFDRDMHTLQIFKVADKYDLDDLGQLVSEDFVASICNGGWEAPDFGSVISELYEECPDNEHGMRMRSAILEMSVKHEEELTTWKKHRSFRDAVRDVTLFGASFSKASLEDATKIHSQKMKDATRDCEDLTETLLKSRTKRLEAGRVEHLADLKKTAEEHRIELQERTLGFGEKRFRCPAKTCSLDFVAFMGVRQWLRCPYCDTLVPE